MKTRKPMTSKKKNPAHQSEPDLRNRPTCSTMDDQRKENVNAGALLIEIEPRLAEHYNQAALDVMATEFASRLLLAARLAASEKGF